MLARFWEILKATIAVVALIAAALISADKLDRQRATSTASTAPAEPVVTGAITSVSKP